MTEQQTKTILPQSGWRYGITILLTVVLYIALARLSGHIRSVERDVATVWLPGGLTFALLLLGGYRYVTVTLIATTVTATINGGYPLGVVTDFMKYR